ncbi:MAG: hypothetical protein WBM50_22575 [Acidimicrobiales bacterium]
MTDQTAGTDEHFEAKIRRRQTIRIGVIAVLVLMAAALALDNLRSVTIGWVVGDAEAPLVVVLAVVLVLGLAIGWLTGRQDRQA